MTAISATEARNNFFEIMRKSAKGHRVYQIAAKDGDIVMLSKEDYEGLIETLELLSIPGLLKSVRKAEAEIKAGKTYSFEEVFGG